METKMIVQFPDEDSSRMRPTCNDQYQNPYIYGSSLESNTTDITNYSSDLNYGNRPQAYGEPYAANPVRSGDNLTAYSQPYSSSTGYRAGGAQWPPTALQPSSLGDPPITPSAGYYGQQGTKNWIFDAQRGKHYYVDNSGKSHVNPRSKRARANRLHLKDPSRPKYIFEDGSVV